MNQYARFLCLVPVCLAAGRHPGQCAPLTLPQAVEMAVEQYPSVRASLEQVSAAAAGVNLARTGYLPRADFLGQVNRATRNNVFGLVLPQSVLPSVSGPVLGTNGLTNVWGSAVGLLVSWEPFDFGLRKANVDTAESARRRAEMGVARTRLEVGAAAADAFLSILAAEETVRAAEAGLKRARALEQAVEAVTRAGLRPGADLERARAETALARTQLARAEQARAVTRTALAQLLGAAAAEISLAPGPLAEAPPAAVETAAKPAEHPAAREQNAAVEEARARQKALERAWFPRFSLQAASYARGSGAATDGATGGAISGLGPNVQNWAVGLTVTFPALEQPSLRARRQVETHRELAEQARYDQVLRELNGRLEAARAALAGARRVAENTPAQLEAARATLDQAAARYKSGLGAIVEVAEAQRLVAQAEIDHSLARLGVWRAMLGVAAAQGDLQPFLKEAGR